MESTIERLRAKKDELESQKSQLPSQKDQLEEDRRLRAELENFRQKQL